MAAHTIFPIKTVFASLVAIGIAGAAQAQAPSTLDITSSAPGSQIGSVIGGGGATISGGGDDMTITYSSGGAGGGGGATQAQLPRLARWVTEQGNSGIEYLQSEPARGGREAWLTGGGDNAQVVYTSPYQRR